MISHYNWRGGRYCVFKNFVHLIFVTKYRKERFAKEILSIMIETLEISSKK